MELSQKNVFCKECLYLEHGGEVVLNGLKLRQVRLYDSHLKARSKGGKAQPYECWPCLEVEPSVGLWRDYWSDAVSRMPVTCN